jgi:dihydrolipoamide dehydrogenase
MPVHEHDLVVIGAGPGGYIAAIRAAQLGLNVACVEKESALGGTCLRIGCIPSKALLESSERFLELSQTFAKHGIQASGVTLDLQTMMRRKAQVVNTLTRGVDSLFKKNKITRYLGHAKIAGDGRVQVQCEKEAIELRSRNIVIATGSKPASLAGVQLDGDRIGTSTEALAFPEVPSHLVVIGGGYIGLELGSVWRRLGSKVTVVEFLPRILAGLDTEIANEAGKLFAKQGIEFRLGARVTAARAEKSGCVVEIKDADPLKADRVLLAVGRVANTDQLGLETIGVELQKNGQIPVNERFATSAQGIYAIGDVIAGPMLAHKAEEEGIACVEGIVTSHAHVDYNAIPAVVYTQPEIGSVGKTEDQLKEAAVQYRKGTFPFRANARARTLGHDEGFVKVLADTQTDRVLGVHIIGAHAGDLINEAAVAMAFGASSEDLARACHAHPTLGESLREAALAADNRSLNS